MESPVEKPMNDAASDYGSDFSPEEELIVERLLSGQTIEDDNPIVNDIEQYGPQTTLRLPRILGREERSPLFQAARAAEAVAEQINNSTALRKQYPHLSNQLIREQTKESNETPSEPISVEPKSPDKRSPLERFRTQPKKALSVTDLVSPAWCQLQYWYTLTLHGRKKRTAAMKQGSAVHKKLEDQVHTTVKVDIETKEDAWGLRIWNVIQGLRTLRDTGLTRELEIWGVIDGLPVNGIIDEVSYICPDSDLEESLGAAPLENVPPPDQTTISEFFKVKGSSLAGATRSKRRRKSDKLYICDVKTRSARSVPSATAFLPTKMQLMLYHKLLSALATNTVDFSVLAGRYSLDTSKVFSDSFITQVGSLNDEIFYDAPSTQDESEEPNASQDSMTTLLAHNTLSSLWSLMIAEFQLALPHGSSSLGSILKAEYRSRDSGEVVGSKTFAMDEKELATYVVRELEWWRGEREAEGVSIEEAFKCRSCDFAETCDWRLNKIEEAKEKVRMKKKRTSVV